LKMLPAKALFGALPVYCMTILLPRIPKTNLDEDVDASYGMGMKSRVGVHGFRTHRTASQKVPDSRFQIPEAETTSYTDR
jgi:hypothetical protein